MSDVIERIKVICQLEKLSREMLASRTNMNYTRWHNLMNKRGVIRPEELVLVGDAFPKYKHWIVFGEELPKAGQISPMSERDRLRKIDELEDLKSIGRLDPADEHQLTELKMNNLTPLEVLEKMQERELIKQHEGLPPLSGEGN
ncbi:hypothetical protein [Marinimicrobium agarilyticum]|uniref:hypothetical protein n=1 Tax=Marinimicrobium agarilyticum TaxID=306546 RepID=UPI00055CD421|nr:hypothetical protein [Marinimicrobium agarilyticum]